MYSLKTSVEFKGLPHKAFLIINLMYHKVSWAKSMSSIASTASAINKLLPSPAWLAIITVSHNRITQLIQGEEYWQTLTGGL